MDALQKSIKEIKALLASGSVSEELKGAIELFFLAEPAQAKADIDLLDEVFSQHFQAIEENLAESALSESIEQPDEAALERMISQISNSRCDAATSQLLKSVGKLAQHNVRPKVPKLELFAIARTLICHSVAISGVDQGIKDAQNVFESAMEDLAPMLREMHKLRS
jgi:hypothetical protein